MEVGKLLSRLQACGMKPTLWPPPLGPTGPSTYGAAADGAAAVQRTRAQGPQQLLTRTEVHTGVHPSSEVATDQQDTDSCTAHLGHCEVAGYCEGAGGGAAAAQQTGARGQLQLPAQIQSFGEKMVVQPVGHAHTQAQVQPVGHAHAKAQTVGHAHAQVQPVGHAHTQAQVHVQARSQAQLPAQEHAHMQVPARAPAHTQVHVQCSSEAAEQRTSISELPGLPGLHFVTQDWVS